MNDVRVCKECGDPPPPYGGLAFGLDPKCYKRLVWRPRKSQAVRNSDEAARRAHGLWWPNGSRPRRAAKCNTCGKFKSRPSSVCGSCGNDPVTFNGNRETFDREHGFDTPGDV